MRVLVFLALLVPATALAQETGTSADLGAPAPTTTTGADVPNTADAPDATGGPDAAPDANAPDANAPDTNAPDAIAPNPDSEIPPAPTGTTAPPDAPLRDPHNVRAPASYGATPPQSPEAQRNQVPDRFSRDYILGRVPAQPVAPVIPRLSIGKLIGLSAAGIGITGAVSFPLGLALLGVGDGVDDGLIITSMVIGTIGAILPAVLTHIYSRRFGGSVHVNMLSSLIGLVVGNAIMGLGVWATIAAEHPGPAIAGTFLGVAAHIGLTAGGIYRFTNKERAPNGVQVRVSVGPGSIGLVGNF